MLGPAKRDRVRGEKEEHESQMRKFIREEVRNVLSNTKKGLAGKKESAETMDWYGRYSLLSFNDDDLNKYRSTVRNHAMQCQRCTTWWWLLGFVTLKDSCSVTSH